jgi:hypothetical protein
MNSGSDRCSILTALIVSLLSMRVPIFIAALCLASAAQATITVHPEDKDGRIFVDVAGEIYYSELMPKRSVPFVDEKAANLTLAPAPPPEVPTPPLTPPPPPKPLPQPSAQTTQVPKRPFRVVDASDGFLQIRNGPGPTYQEIAKIPLGSTVLVGRCLAVEGGYKPFCEVEWQGMSGWASSCCMASLEETTQFSYRVTQNLFLRSGPE